MGDGLGEEGEAEEGVNPTDRALLDAIAEWMRLTVPNREGYLPHVTREAPALALLARLHDALDAYEDKRKERKP